MNTYKILIADDEESIAMDIAERLEALGHTIVATVSTGEDAIEHARDAEIVLMDVALDGPVDGIEAASTIRECYRLPVLFLTTQADPSTIERAKMAAPFGCIVKPVIHASLHPSIEIAMHKHQMELRLEESEAWLRATLESVPDAVIVTDPHGQIRLLNPAAETLGAPAPAFLSSILPADLVPLAILENAPVAIRLVVADKWVEGFAAPLRSSGVVVGGIVTLREVTSRRHEERRLRQLERSEMAARLATSVADDFANLILVIRNHSEQLERQFPDYSRAHAALRGIQRAASEADKIAERLADLGTRPSGHIQVFSLNGILQRMSKLIQSIAGEKVAVTICTHAGVGKIYADAANTELLITKLVLHAVKALPAGGELRLETAAADDHVSLSVSASGELADYENVDLSLMSYLTQDGNRTEAFFPRWTVEESTVRGASTLLLIEPRERVRARLHNFLEANGFNLLEASDDEQANTLLEFHEVDLVLGGMAERGTLPVLPLAPQYTKQELLEQIRAVLAPRLKFSASAQ